MAEYVLAFDFGTESVRASVVDLQGKVHGSGVAPYVTQHPAPGYAEQQPLDWWEGAATATRAAVTSAAIPPEAIMAIGYDCTSCTVVTCRNDGMPVRPAIIWMDVRAEQETLDIFATGDPALRYHAGRPPSAEWMAPKALWLQRHEPEALRQAEVVAEATDWITHQLTGMWTVSRTNASMRWHYNSDRGGWPISLYAALGLGEVLERFPTAVVPLGETAGTLTQAAAEWLGLRAGVPVAQGAPDAFVAVLGLGVVEANAVGIVTGSSHCHFGLAPRHAPLVAGLFGPYPEAILAGYDVLEGGQTSTGSTLRWYVERVLGRIGYAELDGEAAQIPPGAEGVVVLDYWQGNRTPYTDARARGLISGLTLKHDYRHVYRAIMEAVAFGTAQIVDAFRHGNMAPSLVTLCGGVTKSDLWLQMHADVTGCAIRVPEEPNSTILGSAILAATAAGGARTLLEAATQMVRFTRTVVPSDEAHAAYMPAYHRYLDAYPYIRDWMKAASTIRVG